MKVEIMVDEFGEWDTDAAAAGATTGYGSTVDRLETCKMYMKHDLSLVVIWGLQMVALSLAYYTLIKRNNI